jgi:hypothetical protein
MSEGEAGVLIVWLPQFGAKTMARLFCDRTFGGN